MALVHEPEILFLDEPTTGLDPASRREMWREIRRLNTELGITIFLTTQYMEEADELAERVVIIDHGRISAEGSPARLKAAVGGESLNLRFDTRKMAEGAMSELAGMGERIQLDREMVRLYVSNPAEAVPAVLSRLQQAGMPSISLTLSQPTLDDVFLQVTGNRLEAHEMPTGTGPETGSKAGTAVMSREE
jgi:ABC-2 type transport system ATP-binding protein